MGNKLSTNNYRNDFKPEQNIGESQKIRTSPPLEQINSLKSHVKSWVLNQQKMRILGIQTGVFDVLVLCGNGNLSNKLLSYPDIYLHAVYFENHTSLRFTENQFKLLIRGKLFLLPTFEMLLNGSMSEGDFKQDLLRDFPSEYAEIWSVLTSKGNFEAHYYYDSRTKEIDERDYLTKFDLLQKPSRLLRCRRNPFSGELIARVFGQVIPQIPFEGANWSLNRISFLNKTGTTATIDFSLLKSCFVLHLDGKTYDLPNYVEALTGTITQIEFKNRLCRDNEKEFEKIWTFLVERGIRHQAYYTRKLEW